MVTGEFGSSIDLRLEEDSSGRWIAKYNGSTSFYLPVNYILPDAPAGQLLLTEQKPKFELAVVGYNRIIVFLDGVQMSKSATEFDGAPLLVSGLASFEKSANGTITELSSTEFTYDALGRVTKQESVDLRNEDYSTPPTFLNTGPEHGDVITEYDPMGNLVRTTTYDPTSSVYEQITIETRYDSRGNAIEFIDSAGASTYASYDVLERAVTTTDELGRTTAFTYDDLGRTRKVVSPDPDGTGELVAPTVTNRYSLRGELVSATDQLGRVTISEYDVLGRLEKTTLPDPDGPGSLSAPTTKFTYDLVGNLLTSTNETDPRTIVTEYKYDNRHRQIETILDSGGADEWTTKNEYDAAGRLERTYDLNNGLVAGAVTEFDYDRLNRVFRTTVVDAYPPDGANSPIDLVTETRYNALGLVESQTIVDTDGNAPGFDKLDHDLVTTYVYELSGRLLETKLANGDTTWHTYDEFGRLRSTIDSAGNETFFEYNDQQLVSQETTSAGTTYFTYFDNGNLESTTDREGRIRTFSYDSLDRLVQENWLDPANSTNIIHNIDWTYNDAGLVNTVSDGGSTYTYTYDDLDRIRNDERFDSDVGLDFDFSTTYDDSGNVFQRVLIPSAVVQLVVDSYQFDRLNRDKSIHRNGLFGGHDLDVDYFYGEDGNRERLERSESENGVDFRSVADTITQFDNAGRLESILHSNGSLQPLAEHGYMYDAASRLRDWEVNSSAYKRFTYDDAGQVKHVQQFQNGQIVATQDYSYTDGNLTSTGGSAGRNYIVGDLNQVGVQTSPAGFEYYTYDDEGNLTDRSLINNGADSTFEWDHRNRLTKVASTVAGAPKTVEFEYDVFDQLIVKRVDDDGDGVFDFAERYVYDNGNLSFVFDDALLTSGTTAIDALKHRYFYGTGTDQLLADERILTAPERSSGQTWGQSANVHWTLTDHQNSTRQILDYDHSTLQSSVVKELGYTEFGEIDYDSDSSVESRFGFTGRVWDPDVELAYHRARWYAPDLGRWISEDPSGFDSGDANFYRYVGNNPVSFVDPSGLSLETPRQKQAVFVGPSADLVNDGTYFSSGGGQHGVPATQNIVVRNQATLDGLHRGDYVDFNQWKSGTDFISRNGKVEVTAFREGHYQWLKERQATAVLSSVPFAGSLKESTYRFSREENLQGTLALAAFAAEVLPVSNVGRFFPTLGPVDNVAPRSVANATPEAYAGVREASQYLREAGVPRHIRKQVLESFDRQSMRVRVAGDAEFGIRYFDNVNAWPKGRYLFDEFPATRNSLALPPEWNQMTHFRQFQIRPGTVILEGPAARQGFYPGGQTQKYISNLDDLLGP